MKITEAEQKFKAYCRRYTAATQESYARNLSNFLSWLPDTVTQVDQISPEHVQSYLDRILANGNKRATYNLHLNVIRCLFKYLCKFCGYDDNPAKCFDDLKTDDAEVRFLSEKEFNAIKELEGMERDQAVFIAYTGLRVSEFCNLRLSDFAENYLSLTITGKGRKKRCIPLNSTCREILQRYEGKINYGHRRKKLRREDVKKKCETLAKKAGIRHFYPHSLRHYFATSLLMKGVRIHYVSQLMGHSCSLITERTYIHIPAEHLKDVTECLVAV